ncbi:GDSL esterase/lipase 4-like [Neltuma alba]|uniref:GDSL esterase/lipase 4-like n=1 Tax=Neltuma alba TaxID=207710 RepID=UPI0010A3A21B|nr:GDSL esterase/lipase 4-like [Prosopis alba]
MATSGLIIRLFSLLCIIPVRCCAKSCRPTNDAALFVFGDSLFDVGNNNYLTSKIPFQANRFPYGQTFFNYPSGRYTDGRTIVDFVAEYANLPLALPYLHPAYRQWLDGANFASGGSGALCETGQGQVIDLKTQLEYFKNFTKLLRKRIGEEKAKGLISKAVYLISIGSNDYVERVVVNSSAFSSYSRDQYVDLVMGNLTTVIEEIHNEGGRKYGFLGLGPIGCVPQMKMLADGTCCCHENEASVLAKLHNKALSWILRKLQKQLKGFKYSLANFYDSLTDLINNPIQYGFKEGGVACCGSGPYRGMLACGGILGRTSYELCRNSSEYVFFDSVHPTDRANQFFAQQMWIGHPHVAAPYNLKSLFKA